VKPASRRKTDAAEILDSLNKRVSLLPFLLPQQSSHSCLLLPFLLLIFHLKRKTIMLSSITSVATLSLLAASSLAASVPIKRDYECSSLLPTTISVNGTALSTTETTHINEGDVLSSEFYTGHGASCNGAISIGMAKGDKIPDSIFSSE